MPPNEAGACESLQEGVRVCVGLSLFLCSLSLSLSLLLTRCCCCRVLCMRIRPLLLGLLPASSA